MPSPSRSLPLTASTGFKDPEGECFFLSPQAAQSHRLQGHEGAEEGLRGEQTSLSERGESRVGVARAEKRDFAATLRLRAAP